MRYGIGLLMLSLLFAGCLFQQQVETGGEGTTQLPNPAAVNCQDKGYDYETRTDPLTGGEFGVCKYQGKECDAWRLYREECCLQDSDCACTAGTAKCENQECKCVTEEPEVPEEEPEEVPEEPEETEEMLPDYSDKTVEEFLDEGIDEIKNEFFRTHDGDFVTRSVKWIMAGENATPDQITITAGLENAVLFNGESTSKIRGFGFMLFTPAEGGLADAGAIAVFNARDTMLDLYYENKGLDLDIEYRFNTKVYELHNCEVTEKQQYLAEDSSWITNYMLECGYGEQIS